VLVLDTDAISLIQRGTGAQFKALSKLLDDSGDDVFVTVISLDEQLHGAFREIASSNARIRVRGYRRLRDIAEDYAGRPMLDYDDKADSIFDRLKGMKRRPATKDLRIASIVLSHDAILVTGNVRDFERIPTLKLMPITMQ
jgi:tRNA(fMet)-specific endonuclease VapC